MLRPAIGHRASGYEQLSPAHVPLQHCVFERQKSPVRPQLQVPASHVPPQQSDVVVHVSPATLQQLAVGKLLCAKPHTAVESQHAMDAELPPTPTPPHTAPVAAQQVPFWHVPNKHVNGPEQSVLTQITVLVP
jgi:hypothetical protein